MKADKLIELIEKVKLKKVGRHYVMLCPFHDEHTPSMTLNYHQNSYHCFGCSKAGLLDEINIKV